ncbi:retrovirus-related pol polyprotein from transposon TNT 1-94 [Tanacetum coccineum]
MLKEIWLRIHQMMKGSDIGIQEKKDKLFNEWERFTSTDGESIESYYHHFLKLINDFKRNKYFLEKIASMNLGQDNQMQMVGGNGGIRLDSMLGRISEIRITNQNRNGNVVAARDEGNANGNNGNQIRCYNCIGLGHLDRKCIVRPKRRDVAYLQT